MNQTRRTKAIRHPRLHGAALLPVGRALLILLLAELALVVIAVATGRIIGDVAWFLAAFALTSTLFLLTSYDVVVDALHFATNADDDEVPERFSLPPQLARSQFVKWAQQREKHLAWLLFGAGIVAGHLWWH